MLIDEGDLDWPLAAGLCTYADGLSDEIKAAAEELAVDWLWTHTARVYGTRSVVYRPQTRVLCVVGPYWYPPFLQPVGGPLFGWEYAGSDPNWLGVRQILELPAPVVAPSTDVPIVVDVYDPKTAAHTAYSTADVAPAIRREGDWLVRQDGGNFPDTQNLIAKLGAANTWSVSYVRGIEVPTAGQIAAALLACEFAKALSGDAKCLLPPNVTQVSRGNVSITRDAIKGMTRTGVAIVDRFVDETNPNNLQAAPQVWSPDTARNARLFAGSYVPPS